jgi:tetratricopeptide (TPR) repeat protein
MSIERSKTNYGSQVEYNYGTISNYFCHGSDGTHQCDFPIVSQPNNTQGSLYSKIEKARGLYKSRRWTDAKILFYEVLHTQYPLPAATDRILIQYHLAHAHFALAEFFDAARQFQDVVDIHEERNENPDKGVRDSRYWLARSFYHLERYEEASTELQIFVLTSEESDKLGAEQATTGRLWLGLTFERLKLYEDAKDQLKIAFDTRVRISGPQDLDTLACRHHLANFLYKQKSFLEAQEHFDALLQAEERLSGPEKAEAVQTRCMLAFCLAKLQRYDEAEPHLQRVLTRMDSIAPWHMTRAEVRDTGLVCYWLGRFNLRKDQGHLMEEAGHQFQRALNCITDATANEEDEHINTVNKSKNDLQEEFIDCRRCLAITMCHQGQFAGAEQTFRQVIDALDGTNMDKLIAGRFGLASSLIGQRKFTEAKSTLEEFVTAKTPIENSHHTGEDLSGCLHLLGVAYQELHRYQEARDCFQRVVDIVPDSPDLHHTRSQYWLGLTLFEMDEFESATKHFQKVYDISTQHLPSRLQYTSRFWLAWSMCEMGRFEEAEPHLRPTFTMFPSPEKEPVPGSDFILGRSHYYIGRIVSYQKDMKEAAKHYRIALPMLRRNFGPDNPTYLQCRYHLAYSLFKLLEYGEARPIFVELMNIESQHTIIQDLRLILAPYWLGRIAHLQKKPQDSAEYFAKCLEGLGSKTILPLHPTISVGNIQYHHAHCLYNIGKLDECITKMSKTLDNVQEPDIDSELLVLGRWLLGRCLYFTKKYSEASEYLRLTLTEYESKFGYDGPQTLLARVYLADSLCELQRYAEADPLLINTAAQQAASPGTEEGLIKAIGGYWLGRRSFDRGQVKEAEGHFNSTRTLLAANRSKNWDHMRIDCRHFLARIQQRKGQYSEAENVFGELAKQQYESGELPHAVENQYWFGFCLYYQNKLIVAQPVLQKILDDNQEARFTKHLFPSCQFLIGHCLFRQQKIREAKHLFETALEYPAKFPTKFRTRFFLAQSNHRLGLYEEAKQNFQDLVVSGHSDLEIVSSSRYWLGKTHFELQDWDGATTHLQIAHNSSKKEWQHALEAEYFLGRAQFATAKYELALGHFRSVGAAKNGRISAMALDSQYYIGLTLFEMKLFQQARKTLLLVLSRRRKQTPPKQLEIMSTRYYLARCLDKIGICSEAESEFVDVLPFFQNRSAEGDQTIVYIQYELGCISFRHKHWERALDFFQDALLSHETVHVNSSLDVLQCQSFLASTLASAILSSPLSNIN